MHNTRILLILFALLSLTLSSHIDDLDQGSYVWTKYSNLTNIPPSTQGSTLTYVGSRTFFSFGGAVEPTNFIFLNDIYSLYVFGVPFIEPTWTLIEPIDGVKPPVRAYHQAIYDFINIRYLIYGGGGVTFGGLGVVAMDDMWSYSLLDNKWTQLDDLPVGIGLAGAAASTFGRYIDSFGGVSGFDSSFNPIPTNATWRYDVLFNKWLQLFPDPSPPGRILSQYFDTYNSLYVNGGRDNVTTFSDTWRWFPITQQWVDITQSVNYITPGRQGGFGLAVSSIFAFVYGGQDNDQINCTSYTIDTTLGDMWVFNPANNNWNQITTSGDSPPPLSNGGGACDFIYGDCYIVAGIYRNCTNDINNDNLYRFTTILT